MSYQVKGTDGNIKESKHQTAWKDHIYISSMGNQDGFDKESYDLEYVSNGTVISSH